MRKFAYNTSALTRLANASEIWRWRDERSFECDFMNCRIRRLFSYAVEAVLKRVFSNLECVKVCMNKKNRSNPKRNGSETKSIKVSFRLKQWSSLWSTNEGILWIFRKNPSINPFVTDSTMMHKNLKKNRTERRTWNAMTVRRTVLGFTIAHMNMLSEFCFKKYFKFYY